MFSKPMLARLQELKLWQGNYDNFVQSSKSEDNVTCFSNYETIEGLSVYDTSNSSCGSPQKIQNNSNIDWDGKKISTAKPFEQLLEEKLAEENAKPIKMSTKPKKPFLRKGSGLSRFNMSPVPTKKPVKRTSPRTSPKISEQMKETSSDKENKQSVGEMDYITPLKVPNIGIQSKASWKDVRNENEIKKNTNPFSQDVLKKINEFTSANIEKSTEIEENLNESCGEQTLYERALEKELKMFEALEEKAEHSSFSSTNSSVVRILSSSTPNKRKNLIKSLRQPILQESKSTSPSKIQNTANLYTKWLQMNEKTNFINHVLKELNTNGSDCFTDDEKWSESSIADEEFTLEEPTLRDVCVNTSFVNESDIVTKCTNCACLEQKISRLIQDKQKLNNSFDEFKRIHEHHLKATNKMKKEYEEEIEDLKEQLNEQKKKLSREKMIVDKYVKDRPSKKEREEISNLKKELADLQELMKLKETKNGSSLARLRNHIKQLEKESNEMKTEIEKLRKENGKLLASQKVVPRANKDNTKMLHKINENLTKLTQETKKKNASDDIKEKRVKTDVIKSRKSESSLDMTAFVNLSLERQYEKVFGDFENAVPNTSLDDSKKERIEMLLEDGTKEIKYSNGNTKTISPDGNLIIFKYFNGDIEKTNLTEKTLKYYHAKEATWYTQFEDGSELIEFSNGQTERRTVNGCREIRHPSGVIQLIKPDGIEEVKYVDGSLIVFNKNGDRILHLPNGQKEIHMKDQKRREYPDGTVKILYADGSQETRFPNGRVRKKNCNGVLVFDSENVALN